MESLIQELVVEYAKLDGVEAITLAGSRASGRNDSDSDIDLDLFISKPISLEKRRAIALKFADEIEIGNEFFGSADEYITRERGIDIDVCLFGFDEIKENLHRVMDKYQVMTGYTTCFVHNVINAKLLYDRVGEFETLQALYTNRYPLELKKAIVDTNYPILRETFSSYYHQIEKAIKRQDLNSINHRVTAFLASYYDIIFAINEMVHPGEKRLLSIIETRDLRRPLFMKQWIEEMIQNIGINHDIVLLRLNQLVDELRIILIEEQLLFQ